MAMFEAVEVAVAGILSLGRREYGIHLRTGLEQHLGHAVEGLIGRRAQVDGIWPAPATS
jgi:hypothetical protein